jgi:hypothetical protein
VTENIASNYHLPSSGSKECFFPLDEVSEALKDSICINGKTIHSLPCIDEVTIKRYVEDPIRDITLIKTILPKLENFEKRMS